MVNLSLQRMKNKQLSGNTNPLRIRNWSTVSNRFNTLSRTVKIWHLLMSNCHERLPPVNVKGIQTMSFQITKTHLHLKHIKSGFCRISIFILYWQYLNIFAKLQFVCIMVTCPTFQLLHWPLVTAFIWLPNKKIKQKQTGFFLTNQIIIYDKEAL